MSPARPALVLSCEHASHALPAALRPRFDGAGAVLTSHRAWDSGALDLARDLSRATGAPLFAGRWNRLVVDLNRSEDHPRVFSEFIRDLDHAAREGLLARVHRPHRARVAGAVAAGIARRDRAVHLGCHSFTPVLDGRRRDMDIGLLHDPRRAFERRLSEQIRARLAARAPELRVAFNRPYRGTSDGLTTTLRRRFGARAYAGIELEVNQARLTPARRWATLRRMLVEELTDLLAP